MGWLDDFLGLAPATTDPDGPGTGASVEGGSSNGDAPLAWLLGDAGFERGQEDAEARAAVDRPIRMTGGETALPPSYLWLMPDPAGAPFAMDDERRAAERERLIAAWKRDREVARLDRRAELANPPHDRYWDVFWGRGSGFEIADNPAADGSRPLYEDPTFSEVAENEQFIMDAARRTGVDPDLIRAIMYMETTHGYYDRILGPFDANDTIRPMNVSASRWEGYLGDRDRLEDPAWNTYAGARILQGIIANLPEDATIEQIATLYNGLRLREVNDYGARVGEIYRERLWEHAPEPLQSFGPAYVVPGKGLD
jgi:hypothetical protein